MIFNVLSLFTSQLLDNIVGSGQILDPANTKVGLYVTGPTVTPPVNKTDFTYPDVAAFPLKTITAWNAPDLQADGSWQVTSGVLDFTFATFTEATNFAGAYIINTDADPAVTAWGAFPDLVQFLSADAHARFVMRVTVFLDSTYRLDVIRVDE